MLNVKTNHVSVFRDAYSVMRIRRNIKYQLCSSLVCLLWSFSYYSTAVNTQMRNRSFFNINFMKRLMKDRDNLLYGTSKR